MDGEMSMHGFGEQIKYVKLEWSRCHLARQINDEMKCPSYE